MNAYAHTHFGHSYCNQWKWVIHTVFHTTFICNWLVFKYFFPLHARMRAHTHTRQHGDVISICFSLKKGKQAENVKKSPMLKHYAMMMYGRGKVSCILNLSSRWRWVFSFTVWLLYPLWIGGCMDHIARREKSLPCQESGPSSPACSRSLYWVILAHRF